MYKVATVFGIRPDFIRASILLKRLIKNPEIDLQFIYTGQHYDEELKGVFFRELGLPEPQFILDATGKNHVEQHSKLIGQLGEALEMIKPDVCLFLGDANAVIGCIAPLKMGIPIAHVEAGMRSFNWNMPEERNRVIVDRVSDVLYAYQHDYKTRLVQEGINPNKVVVTGNTICDVIDYYMPEILAVEKKVLRKYGMSVDPITPYGVMTMHRNENVKNKGWARNRLDQISDWAKKKGIKIILPMMPRLREVKWKDKNNSFIITKPLGMFEWMALEKNAAIEFTDSGTNQETSSIFGVPCVIIRNETERPETFDCGNQTMVTNFIGAAADDVYGKKSNGNYTLRVEGKSPAEVIESDLLERLKNKFATMGIEDPFKMRHVSDWPRLKYMGAW